MKILGKSFPKFLSLCKIFGTAILLLLGNPSEGINLPGNFIVFSDVALSSPAVVDLNHASIPMPFAMDEKASLFAFPVSALATDPVSVTVCEGGNVTFSVSASGSFQWQESPNLGNSWNNISGQVSSSFLYLRKYFLISPEK